MILCRKPHFTVRDANLYFLNATRPIGSLSDAATALWAQLDHDFTMSDADTAAADELIAYGACERISPTQKDGRRKVLVLEPHGDDAALSIGGTMWQRRNEVDFTLVTLASRSNYTSSFQTGRDYFDRDTVSALRAKEGALFMAHLGGHYQALGLNEATLRYKDSDWSSAFFQAHRISAAANNNRRADADILAQWVDRISALMMDETFEEVWIPLGAGTHSDHDLTRNAALTVLMQYPQIMARAAVYLYKDVPYGTDFAEHTDRLLRLLTGAGATLTESFVDITDSLDKKLDLLGIFASQFKRRYIEVGVRHSAAFGAHDGRSVEHMWQLISCPARLDTNAMFMTAPKVKALRPRLKDWYKKTKNARRLQVLLLGASGNWAADEAMLRARFPEAQVDVYASDATYAEVDATKGDDVILHVVGRGKRVWIPLLLKAFLQRHPALFVAGASASKVQNLTRQWPFSRILVVESLNDVALADDS